MTYYRRNTFSDKLVSFLGIFLAVIMLYSSYQRYEAIGSINGLDVGVAIVGLGVGILFLYTSRFKYIELTDKSLTWYTWFFVKHTLTTNELKDITTKQRYFILSRKKGGDIWLSKFYIKKEDDEAVVEGLKKLIEGK